MKKQKIKSKKLKDKKIKLAIVFVPSLLFLLLYFVLNVVFSYSTSRNTLKYDQKVAKAIGFVKSAFENRQDNTTTENAVKD